ncbi:MAG: 3'-5' exonuclease [Pseudomonadota bacterium]
MARIPKLFWFDTETTGTERYRNSMIQLSALIEIGGEVVEELNLFFRPLPDREISQDALDINGRTLGEIESFPDAADGVAQLKAAFNRHVKKFDKNDKLVPAGFNTGFDTDFLRETFFASAARFPDKKEYGPGSYLFNAAIDVRHLIAEMIARKGFRSRNFKLSTCCLELDVPLDNAHDALADIRSTRALYYRCMKELGYSQEAAHAA